MISRRVSHPIGWLVAVAAGAFFLRYAWHSLAGKDLSALLEPAVIGATIGLCVLYMLLIPVTAFAWGRLLHALNERVSFRRLLPILATTQFGKYLPGNVAHHFGRVALLRMANVRLSSAVLSLAYEMLLQLVACAHLSALTLLWALPAELAHWPLFTHRWALLLAVTAGAVLALTLIPRFARWFANLQAARRGEAPIQSAARGFHWKTAAGCYLLYAANFLFVGAGMHLIAVTLAEPGTQVPGVAYMTGAFASSWVLGFLAPGAPAGLGVREVILSAWLAAIMPADRVVVLVVALRIATTAGDLLNFLAGSLSLRRTASSQ